MSKTLMFMAGASLTFVVMSAVCIQPIHWTTMVALAWFGGVVVGGWAVGLGMFMFAQFVGNSMAERFYPPKKRKEEEITLADVVEEDIEDIYDDADWWKDEKKRDIHRRNQNG